MMSTACRAIAEEDHRGGPGPVAAAAGSEGGRLYTAGSTATSKLPSLDAWLTKGAGMYPDVVESLVKGHLGKGDQMSALITSEWYMRPGHFPGWARPYEFNAELYRELGRGEEARDSARIALNMPWWTLSSGFQAIAALAELPANAADVQKALSDELKATSGGALPPGIGMATKTDQQVHPMHKLLFSSLLHLVCLCWQKETQYLGRHACMGSYLPVIMWQGDIVWGTNAFSNILTGAAAGSREGGASDEHSGSWRS